MVGVQVLVIIVRLLEIGLEMDSEGHRTVPVASERVDVESHVRLYLEVVDLMSEEIVFTGSIPFEILLDVGRRKPFRSTYASVFIELAATNSH